MASKRILIVRMVGLGDVAVATVLLSGVRRDEPDAHVTWLCGDGVAPLVRLLPGVDEVIATSDWELFHSSFAVRARCLIRTWRALLGRRFDRVLLVHSDWRYRALVLPLMGARMDRLDRRRGPGGVSLASYRGTEYMRLWSATARGGPEDLVDLRTLLGEAAASLRPHGRRVVLVPGGARNVLRDDDLRRWPVTAYRSLAEDLLKSGFEVALIGDANDRRFIPSFDGLAVTSYIGKLSLHETLQVLRDASVVVSCDSGPLHLARLVRTPVVGLFGPTIPDHVLGIDGTAVRTLWGGAHLACRPCYDGRDYAPCRNNICMESIRPRTVYDAVCALASSTEPAGQATT